MWSTRSCCRSSRAASLALSALASSAWSPRLSSPAKTPARAVSSNPESYVYLAESIRAWPAQREMAQQIADAGWEAVRWRNLSGGIVALHHAVREAP